MPNYEATEKSEQSKVEQNKVNKFTKHNIELKYTMANMICKITQYIVL